MRNVMFDVWTAAVFGVAGYIMRVRGWPAAPLILGFILGPMFEQQLRAALQMTGGNVAAVVNGPIVLSFLAVTVVVVASSCWRAVAARRQGGEAAGNVN